MLFQTIYSNFLHTMKVREDVDGVEDNTANNYMQRSGHQHAPYNNIPPSPPQYSGSPAPLLRMCSAPLHLPSSKQLGEGPSNLAYTSEEVITFPKQVKHTSKVTAV